MTLDEIRERSLHTWRGHRCWCWDCEITAHMFGFPCSTHCTPDEKVQLDAETTRRLNATVFDPDAHVLTAMVKRER